MTKRPTPKPITVVHATGATVPVEIMAEHIAAISRGIKKLRAGPLNEKALILLIQNAIPEKNGLKVSQSTIKQVFTAIDVLEATYLKKKPVAVAKS